MHYPALHTNWPIRIFYKMLVRTKHCFSRLCTHPRQICDPIWEQYVCIKLHFLSGNASTENVTRLQKASKNEASSHEKLHDWFFSVQTSRHDTVIPTMACPSNSTPNEDVTKIRNAINNILLLPGNSSIQSMNRIFLEFMTMCCYKEIHMKEWEAIFCLSLSEDETANLSDVYCEQQSTRNWSRFFCRN